MSFIKDLVVGAHATNPYEALGYQQNPFPRQGEVRDDIYVERPELRDLRDSLKRFLLGSGGGAVWALEGLHGVGKSNFLAVVNRELQQLTEGGSIPGAASRLVPTTEMRPRRIAEEILRAIGQDRITSLLRTQAAEAGAGYEGTDFERFWKAPRPSPELAAEFFWRWLSGGQTYKSERDAHNIVARERLPPTVAFSYLRELMEMLRRARLIDRLVLLLDEFEDIQRLSVSQQSEFVQVIKTFFNVFNWSNVYVIIAGAPTAFRIIAERYPSLSARWTRVGLKPLEDPAQGLAFAHAYMDAAKATTSRPTTPSDQDILAEFQGARERAGFVVQREFLTRLNQLVESRLPST